MNLAFLTAAGLSLFTWAVHLFAGTPSIARPLMQSALPDVPRLTHFYCWHLVTLTLGAMVAGFGYAAVWPSGVELGVLFTVLAGLFSLWSVILVIAHRRKWHELPQWVLFLPIFIAGAVGFSG